jgi:type I restriction enzyme R subunit
VFPIAVIEAKDNNHTVSQGMQQALAYAEILQVPSVFSSNGDAFASHNKVALDGEEIETQFPLESFPPPDDIWKRYNTTHQSVFVHWVSWGKLLC